MESTDKWVVATAGILSIVLLMILSSIEDMPQKYMLAGALTPIGAAMLYGVGRFVHTLEE